MKPDERRAVYKKYNGHCAYCGKKIDYKDMQVDHLIPKWHLDSGNFVNEWDKINTFENYMPACRRCNHYKRGNTLEGFRKMIETIPQKLFRDSYIFKVGVDYGFFNSQPIKVVFYYESNKALKEKNNA